MMRLDRLIGKWLEAGKRRTRAAFEAGEVRVNGVVILEGAVLIGKFDRVECRNEIVRNPVRRVLMLHKPSGVVSATTDGEHGTVIDLIGEEWAAELHLAGRLDRFTTGLVILTNDSHFSESLTEPGAMVGKRYLVEVDGPIRPEVIRDFQRGLWLAKEQVMTSPAKVDLLESTRCRLTIYEGKHHQVKRMFAKYDLKVTALHREAIGTIELPENLAPGEWRSLI